MQTFEDFARENDILWNRVRAVFGDAPLPPREYGLEAECTVKEDKPEWQERYIEVMRKKMRE